MGQTCSGAPSVCAPDVCYGQKEHALVSRSPSSAAALSDGAADHELRWTQVSIACCKCDTVSGRWKSPARRGSRDDDIKIDDELEAFEGKTFTSQFIIPAEIEGKYRMKLLDFDQGGDIFNINLHDGEEGKQNVQKYYELCKEYAGLQVTTSCFTVWKDSKKSNSKGKVIPATSGDNVCVFFFDDNMEFDGQESSSGICNLRDVTTGDFVEYNEGRNGFMRARAAKHTIVHYSTCYRNVLVKANILDAMEDPDYFADIVQRYALPDEKVIVYMDVNSTIVSTDSVQGKGLEDGLLSVLFELIEFKPYAAFDLDWNALPPFRIEEKPKTLKSYVKELTQTDSKAYTAFWKADNCLKFVSELAGMGEMQWVTPQESNKPITNESFRTIFQEYLTAFEQSPTVGGIARSWFRVFEQLKLDHTVVLNSFGVDTLKVVKETVPPQTQVMQVTVNYEKWDERDVKKFKAQFSS